MKKIFKKVTMLTTAFALVLGMTAVPSQAASAPRIEDVDYEGKGVVEVQFTTDVQYKKESVTVKDNKGKKYKATVIKKDEDDLKFKIRKFKTGRTYTFRVKGVKRWDGGSYKTVKGKVKIAKKYSAKSGYIGVSKAKKLALADAELKASQVKFVKAKMDYDDGSAVYDVEFYKDGWEYDYEIDARTGNIREKDVDYDDDYEYVRPANKKAKPSQSSDATPEGAKISYSKAKSIALKRAGLKESQIFGYHAELDYEYGSLTYETEFYGNNGMEYECDIDATTGEIVGFSAEWDD